MKPAIQLDCRISPSVSAPTLPECLFASVIRSRRLTRRSVFALGLQLFLSVLSGSVLLFSVDNAFAQDGRPAEEQDLYNDYGVEGGEVMNDGTDQPSPEPIHTPKPTPSGKHKKVEASSSSGEADKSASEEPAEQGGNTDSGNSSSVSGAAAPAENSSSGEPAAGSASGVEGGSASGADAVPTPPPAPRPDELLPLDAWVEPTPEPTPTPTPVVAVPADLDPDQHIGKEEEEEDDSPEAALQLPPEKVSLTAQQKKRVEAAKKFYRKRVRAGRKLYLDFLHRDPRGEPEVRICSLNLNNFGEPEDIKKLISQKEAHKLRAKRRSVITSIDSAKCDIVAVQGLIGTDFIRSQEVLTGLARELSEASSTTWRSFVGLSNHKNANNGVLVGNPDYELLRVKSYNETPLPLEAGFRAKNFARDPFRIDLRIPGRGEAPGRTLSLVTFQFQEALRVRGPESEKKRLQLAEGLRQIVLGIQSDAAAEDPPIVLLAGDFSTARTTASARVLEGTMRLADFGEEGSCEIDGKEVVKCDPKPRHPKLLFGLLTDSLELGDSKPDKKGKIRALNSALARREEIFASPPDLHLTWKQHNVPGHFNSGYEKVRNGLKDAPLVWVELNW